MGGERPNFYKQVHKGIRVLAHSVAEQAARTDFRDAGEVRAAAGRDLARRVLPPADWSRLERSLAVAA